MAPAPLAGFFSKIGLATGPAAAALLLGQGSYALLIGVSVAGLVVCGLAVIIPARLLDACRNTRVSAGGAAG